MIRFLPVLFGLVSAACWGAGDFSGGLATKRTNVFGVIVVSQFVGIILLITSALAFSEHMPSPEHLFWGGMAGLAGVIGVIALYRALASGRMGLAAPVSAVLTAAVPVIFSIFVESLPNALQVVGFGLALIAVWLISQTDDLTVRLHDLGLPIVAGIGFGFFLIIINRVSEASILWPLVAARAASLVTLFVFAMLARRQWLPQARWLPLIFLGGILDAGGNAFFALAGQVGRLDVAAVLASLYPAMTVLLAWLVLKERVSRVQAVGIVAALAAIVLIML